jgi:hypothetical protein
MKTAQRLALALSIAASCIAVGVSVIAQEEKREPLPSTVIRVNGPARVKEEGGDSWRPLKRGQVLLPGCILQTAKGAQVDLVIGAKLTLPRQRDENSTPAIAVTNGVRLLSDSILCLERIEGRPASNTNGVAVDITELDLRSGGIVGLAGKKVGAAKYGVRIPNGALVISEGGFFVDGTGDCGALHTKATLTYSNNKKYEIPAGSWLKEGKIEKWENRANAGDPFPTSPKERD